MMNMKRNLKAFFGFKLIGTKIATEETKNRRRI